MRMTMAKRCYCSLNANKESFTTTTEAQKQLIIQHTIIRIMTVGMSAINQDY